jgi:hypothetical protein
MVWVGIDAVLMLFFRNSQRAKRPRVFNVNQSLDLTLLVVQQNTTTLTGRR